MIFKDKELIERVSKLEQEIITMNKILKLNSATSIIDRMKYHNIWIRQRAFSFRPRKKF